MTLKDWEEKAKWLIPHTTSKQEIRDLLAVGERNLHDSAVEGLSAEARLQHAYAASLQFATAALSASGYRPHRGTDHHVRVVQSLSLTVGWDAKSVNELDAFRKKRNLTSYERPAAVSDAEAVSARNLADRLRSDVVTWLKAKHPELI